MSFAIELFPGNVPALWGMTCPAETPRSRSDRGCHPFCPRFRHLIRVRRHRATVESSLVGWIIVGSLSGIAGCVVGTYFSIKNTLGPRERAFMIRGSVVAWLAITAFLVGLFLLPNPYRHLLWIPYVPALLLGIRWSNRRQFQIRAEEVLRASGSVRK